MKRAGPSKPPSVSSLPPLERYLGYCLHVVATHTSQRLRVRLAEEGVTVAEWLVLRELYDVGTMAPSMVAENLGLSRGAVSKLVDKLVEKSLVARASFEDDRRYQELTLTKEGRKRVPRLAAGVGENDEELFGHLSSAERKALEGALRGIVRKFGLRGITG